MKHVTAVVLMAIGLGLTACGDSGSNVQLESTPPGGSAPLPPAPPVKSAEEMRAEAAKAEAEMQRRKEMITARVTGIKERDGKSHIGLELTNHAEHDVMMYSGGLSIFDPSGKRIVITGLTYDTGQVAIKAGGTHETIMWRAATKSIEDPALLELLKASADQFTAEFVVHKIRLADGTEEAF